MGNQLTEIAPNTPFLPNFQSFHVVVIGLDSAGKTSLLYRLKLKEFVETIPTKGFNTEKIKVPVGNGRAITFQVWDVGGQEKLRPLWKSYTRRTDGLVFVVDSTEVERMEEAKVELHKITRTSENQGVPVLVLANKQDLPVALPVSDVEKVLSVHELSASTLHHVQGCSAVDGQGLHPGLEKLYEMILKRKKMVKHSKKKDELKGTAYLWSSSVVGFCIESLNEGNAPDGPVVRRKQIWPLCVTKYWTAFFYA